ncbi:amidase [Micromonospora sp. LOL_023]|uniref:amidase n=1 Tax=Micromonospora sp. LOL_023 TaxID=3345418 RepID=UPI003A85B957
MTDVQQPLDRLLDRRAFLARTAALAATATVGTVALPGLAGIASAAPSPASGPAVKFNPELDKGAAYNKPREAVMSDPTEWTLSEAAWMIRHNKIVPVELVQAYLDRIAAYDSTYQAFNLVTAESALKAARQWANRPYRGPLHGIPLAIKDNYFTEGVLTTASSYLFQDFVPPYDATSVAKLTVQGGIVLGKTQMGPLATSRATLPNGQVTTINAWTPTNPSTNPGGSSTGTATAVAGRMATSGIGTQTGGSITAPSNAQNLTGIKPTMGRVSLAGIIPLTYSRDHPGPLARDAKDAAIMLMAMAGADPADPRSQGLPPVPNLINAATPRYEGGNLRMRWKTRIGVLPGYADGTSETALARRAFLTKMAAIPECELVEVPLPDEWDLLTGSAFNNVRLPERSEPFMPYLREDLRGFGVSVTSWLQGCLLDANGYVTGQRAKLLLLERILDQIFGSCDVVVQTSPVPFDIVGLPEIAFPIGFTGGGVPIGTILGGLPYAEGRLLSVVAAHQAVSDWHWQRPPNPPVAAPAAARSAAVVPDRGRLTAEEVAELTQ